MFIQMRAGIIMTVMIVTLLTNVINLVTYNPTCTRQSCSNILEVK